MEMLRFLISFAILFVSTSHSIAQLQTTNGDCSPNINDVGGDVVVTCQTQRNEIAQVEFISMLRVLSIPRSAEYNLISWHDLAMGLHPLEFSLSDLIEGREATALVRVAGFAPVDPYTGAAANARILVEGPNAGVFSVSASWQSLTYRDAETILENLNSVFEKGGYIPNFTCGFLGNETATFFELVSPAFNDLYAAIFLTHRPEASHITVSISGFEDDRVTYQSFVGYRDVDC